MFSLTRPSPIIFLTLLIFFYTAPLKVSACFPCTTSNCPGCGPDIPLLAALVFTVLIFTSLLYFIIQCFKYIYRKTHAKKSKKFLSK